MNESGVWTNPAWKAGDPGAFAVVIGVSRYDHLPGGGEERAQETFGLSQLHVCALTAHRFFRWLRERYVSDGVRLARCWVLLSPTSDEVAAESELAHWPRPTFTACANAVAHWFATLRDLAPESACASRSLFFFTGHGLELHQDHQVLLPCDYLQPPASLINRALSTRNLLLGLSGLNVPTQLFFVDACRNDHSRFRDLGLQLTGTDVLNEVGARWASSDVVAPIVYATTTGAQAFQPVSVKDGLSIFGRALIEGVSDPPAEIRKCDGNLCHVSLYPLVEFLSSRVPELLASYGSAATQPVRLGGHSSPVTVTDVDAAAKAAPMPPDPVTTSQRLLSVSANLPSTDWGKLDTDATQVLDIFGSGSMADLWAGHTWRTESGEARRHELVSVARRQVSAYQLVVRVPDAAEPTVFEASDGSALLACRVPALGQDAILRLDAARNDRDRWNLAVSVDPSTPGIVGRAASTWLGYLQGNVAAALQESELFVHPVLAGRSPSPLPALVAALVRLRADRDISLPWLRELALLYPAWPDFWILRGETELRASAASEITERAAATLSAYALPFTTETLSYAAAHAAVVARRPDAVPSAAMTAAQQVTEAVSALQPGGQFCVFARHRRK